MLLTGKCKEDFHNWYWEEWFDDKERRAYKSKEDALDALNFTDKVFLNAVIVQFLDSIGIWRHVVNDTLILDRDYFRKCNWFSNIVLLIITANDIYNSE